MKNLLHKLKETPSSLKGIVHFRHVYYNNEIKEDDYHLSLSLIWLFKLHKAVDYKGFSALYDLRSKKFYEAYPETTGYILATLLKYDLNTKFRFDFNIEKTKNWLLSTQLDCGAFPSGVGVGKDPSIFNSAQILYGLIEYFITAEDKQLCQRIINCCNWLVENQESDGSWKKHFYNNTAVTYSSRVSWALIYAGTIFDNKAYIEAGKKNINWVLSKQLPNGFFEDMGFQKGDNPFTHTISYTLRGLLESYLLLKDEFILYKLSISLNKLLRTYEINKKLSGHYNSHWKSDADYICLTGNAQLAVIFIKYFKISGDARFLNAAYKSIDDIKEKQITDTRFFGAVPGSYPIYGKYMKYTFPNWSVKFFIDALMEKKNAYINIKQ